MDFPLRKLKKSEFPEKLLEIPEPPKDLYIRGEMWNPESKILCIVGSRAYTPYGKQVVDHLIAGLSNQPITIVSGLAMGIDALAHKAALLNGLNTISVPGSGIKDEVLYPSINKKLAKEILEAGGCLLSEFEPDFHATTWSFPQRNRIMAGLSDATLVIEAEIKSGTLITARLATDYNRDVLTVPGSIFSKNTEGPQMLLRLGATPIRNSKDILEALHLSILESPEVEEKRKKEIYKTLSKEEQKIIEAVSTPKSKSDLARDLSIRTAELQGILMMLEIKGLIKEEQGEIRLV